MKSDDISIRVMQEKGRRDVLFTVPRLLARMMRVQDLAAIYGWQMGDRAMLPVVSETYERLAPILTLAPYGTK